MAEPVTKYPGDKITSEWANSLVAYISSVLSHTEANYIIYLDGSTYYAKNGTTNEIDFQGPVLLTVAQDAVDALSEGTIFFRDTSVPVGLVEKDGVILISRNDGNFIERYTNPTVEISAMNPDNKTMHRLVATPTHNAIDVVGTAAWTLLSSEIYGTSAAIGKFLVGAYISAAASSGCTSQIWAVNPTVVLSSDAGAAAEALGVEIDVNNYLAAGKGYGLTIEGSGDYDCNRALWIKRATNKWQIGITFQNILNQAIDLKGDYTNSPIYWTPDTDLNTAMLVATDAANSKTLLQLTKGRLFFNQLDAVTDDFLLFQHDDVERFKLDQTGEMTWAADTNLFRVAANVLATNGAILGIEVASTNNVFRTSVTGDTFDRCTIRADGAVYWGTGGVAQDLYLFRSAVAALRTNGSFQAEGGYKSGDGTTGINTTITTATGVITVKDGLITAYTGS